MKARSRTCGGDQSPTWGRGERALSSRHASPPLSRSPLLCAQSRTHTHEHKRSRRLQRAAGTHARVIEPLPNKDHEDVWSCTISIATAGCCIDLNDVAALHGGEQLGDMRMFGSKSASEIPSAITGTGGKPVRVCMARTGPASGRLRRLRPCASGFITRVLRRASPPPVFAVPSVISNTATLLCCCRV